MPLFEKARLEVYVPDVPSPRYRSLLDALEKEFTYTFGGCTLMRGVHGSYLSDAGVQLTDPVNVLYTDGCIRFDPNLEALSRFTDRLREAVCEALDEEAVLVAAFKVYHSA